MARNKNARQVNYFIKRDRDLQRNLQYWLHVEGKCTRLIKKQVGGWFAGSCYHQTLRDAIIYVLYGV